jgi:hypothetical protein
VKAFLALAIGFAVAGLSASLYELVTCRPASFRLPQRHSRRSTLAAMPLLVLAAPFIIMRNTIRGRGVTYWRSSIVLAAIIAGCWSLLSGTVVMVALTTFGLPVG